MATPTSMSTAISGGTDMIATYTMPHSGEHKILRFERVDRSPRRIDLQPGGVELNLAVTSMADKSMLFSIYYGYNATCECCWLGHAHSVAYHDRAVGGAS